MTVWVSSVFQQGSGGVAFLVAESVGELRLFGSALGLRRLPTRDERGVWRYHLDAQQRDRAVERGATPLPILAFARRLRELGESPRQSSEAEPLLLAGT